MLDYDYRDVEVSLKAMEISRRRLVAADGSKFNGEAMVKLGQVLEIDALFTDVPPPVSVAGTLEANGVRLVVATRGNA